LGSINKPSELFVRSAREENDGLTVASWTATLLSNLATHFFYAQRANSVPV